MALGQRVDMPQPPKSSRRVQELVEFFGGADNVAPVDNPAFARRLGEVIARARANELPRYGAKRLSGK